MNRTLIYVQQLSFYDNQPAPQWLAKGSNNHGKADFSLQERLLVSLLMDDRFSYTTGELSKQMRG